jgi:hypothetical protein
MSTIFDPQLRRPVVLTYTSKMTLLENSLLVKPSSSKSLPQAIFDVRFKTSAAPKEAIQESLVNALAVIDGVEDALESSDIEEVIAVELSGELERRPRPSSSDVRRELLKDNMEMLFKALSTLDTEDFSESSDEEEDDFDDDSVVWF